MQVQTAQGALLANLVLGMSPSGIYMRAPDKEQAWAVRGDLPPLKDPAQWLDLAPLAVDVGRFAHALVQPASGVAYSLTRNERGDFQLDPPFSGYLVVTPDGVNRAGRAFATLRPIDVAAAPAIAGVASARVTTRTSDGLALEGELFEQGGRHWLKLVARGETPAAQTEAQAINARAAAWAYGLSEMDYLDLAPPLANLARAPNALAPYQPPEGAPAAATP